VRWWFAPAPAERLAGIRILVGAFAAVYLLAMLGRLLAVARLPASSFAPIGVVGLVAERPLDPLLWQMLVGLAVALSLAFAVGALHRVLAPLFAAVLLFVLTYRSSWGMIFHTENLLVLHVIVLALAPAADAWSIDAARRGAAGPGAGPGWPLRLLAATTVLTYVLAGVAKLRIGGLDWISGEELRDQVAIDNLRKVLLGDGASALATPLLTHPGAFHLLAALTIAVELGAPIALAGGRIAAAWALTAWGFHVGVALLMWIVFPYPLCGLAYAPLFAIERPLASLGARLAAAARSSSTKARRRRRAPS